MRRGPASFSLFSPAEQATLRDAVRRTFANPYSPREPLAEADAAAVLASLERARDRLAAGARAGSGDRALYVDASLHALITALAPRLTDGADAALPRDPRALFDTFAPEYDRRLGLPSIARAAPGAHSFFASCVQMARTRRVLEQSLLGASRPALRLRAAVWDAVFTCNLRDAVQSPEGLMDDLPVLINGPTGTGKEVVAQAIGRALFVPFDGARWVTRSEPDLQAVNVTALSDTLFESELFGHRRGAFTGAAQAHRGWFETCGRGGVLFFDEIGDLALPAQPKLLRVLETRKFQRVGETTDVDFLGRLVAATQVDLAEAVAAGTFRLDLLQRLSAVVIRTPTLREMIDDDPGDLEIFVQAMAQRVRPSRWEDLADQTLDWIDRRFPDHAWPGNVRELFQCVRGMMVHGEWAPADADRLAAPRPSPAGAPGADPPAAIAALLAGSMDEETLLVTYTNLVHAITRNITETAERLGVHRNTVAARLSPELIDQLARAMGLPVGKDGGDPRRGRRRRRASPPAAEPPPGGTAPGGGSGRATSRSRRRGS